MNAIYAFVYQPKQQIKKEIEEVANFTNISQNHPKST